MNSARSAGYPGCLGDSPQSPASPSPSMFCVVAYVVSSSLRRTGEAVYLPDIFLAMLQPTINCQLESIHDLICIMSPFNSYVCHHILSHIPNPAASTVYQGVPQSSIPVFGGCLCWLVFSVFFCLCTGHFTRRRHDTFVRSPSVQCNTCCSYFTLDCQADMSQTGLTLAGVWFAGEYGDLLLHACPALPPESGVEGEEGVDGSIADWGQVRAFGGVLFNIRSMLTHG